MTGGTCCRLLITPSSVWSDQVGRGGMKMKVPSGRQGGGVQVLLCRRIICTRFAIWALFLKALGFLMRRDAATNGSCDGTV